MSDPEIVTREQWLTARKALLLREKAFLRERDALAREVRALPMVLVDQDYEFDTSDGPRKLSELFGQKSQLMVYHFMFDPSWEQGCKSCSFVADSFERSVVHLAERDISLVAVSRAELGTIQPFKQRMGWTFPWLSSAKNAFNEDFHVSFRDDQTDPEYNYAPVTLPQGESPGLSVFLRSAGRVFHTYSTYARGLDALIASYHYIDLTPKGRDESELSYPMAWVRHRDRYEQSAT